MTRGAEQGHVPRHLLTHLGFSQALEASEAAPTADLASAAAALEAVDLGGGARTPRPTAGPIGYDNDGALSLFLCHSCNTLPFLVYCSSTCQHALPDYGKMSQFLSDPPEATRTGNATLPGLAAGNLSNPANGIP